MVKRADPKETVFTVFVGNITRWSSDYEAIKAPFGNPKNNRDCFHA
jgi:hypothetical protein